VALRIRVEPMVVGLCLVGLGALWTLANFGRLDFLSTVRLYWPVSLIAWGGLELYAFLRRAA
jgi:hypothetical protein